MKRGAFLLCCAAGAHPHVRDPASCEAPAERVEVEQVQVGWNTFTPPGLPTVMNVEHPTRDERQAEALANELLKQCQQGVPMAPLQDKFSEVPGGSQVLGANSDVGYKGAALCLKPGECAVARSNVAWHVIKRIR